MFAVNTSVIVAFEMLLIDSIKRWPLMRTIGWGCFLSCLGFGMLPFGSSVAYCVLAMLIVTVGEMLSMALATGLVANRSTPGSESAYMGWYMVMLAAASVLGPSIGSSIYQASPEAVWITGLVVGVGVLVGFQMLAEWSSRAEVGEEPPVDGVAAIEPSELYSPVSRLSESPNRFSVTPMRSMSER